MLKLYDYPDCPFSQKVRVVLAEKDLEFERVFVDLRRGDQKQPDFLRMNPYGKVPVLVDEDEVVRPHPRRPGPEPCRTDSSAGSPVASGHPDAGPRTPARTPGPSPPAPPAPSARTGSRGNRTASASVTALLGATCTVCESGRR